MLRISRSTSRSELYIVVLQRCTRLRLQLEVPAAVRDKEL